MTQHPNSEFLFSVMNMGLNRLHLFALLFCAISVKAFTVSDSTKAVETEDSKLLAKEVGNKNSNENVVEAQNEYEKMGLKPVVEPPFIKTFISSLCAFGACNPKTKFDITTNYPQSEMTTGLAESVFFETSELPKPEGTVRYMVYTPDEAILGETTSESPPSEHTTE